jgi:hypothetical protein
MLFFGSSSCILPDLTATIFELKSALFGPNKQGKGKGRGRNEKFKALVEQSFHLGCNKSEVICEGKFKPLHHNFILSSDWKIFRKFSQSFNDRSFVTSQRVHLEEGGRDGVYFHSANKLPSI